MCTEKLYQTNVYLKNTNCKITNIINSKETIHILLDRTIFFPTGGGQSCDVGTIDRYTVVDVFEDENKDIHHVLKEKECSLNPGDEVNIEIDWNHRFDNMQRHLGEHILSGVFHNLYEGINRGFHMGTDYMTIDISLEKNSDYKEISWEMCQKAELMTNEIIWKNEPVKTYSFNTKDEAKSFPVRKELELENDIRIVCVGSENNPSDSVACCGTHPDTTGQVGLLKIYKVEINKGMFRIYFEAGKRALLNYQSCYDILNQLSNRYSAGANDLIEKINAREEKNKAIKDRVYKLAKHLALEEENKIRGDISSKPTAYKYSIFSIDELLSIGRNLTEALTSLLFLVHTPSNTVLLFSSGNIDCGKLVKENADIYGGKGGGRRESARAIFPKEEYIDVFIDLLEKHLR